MAKHNISGRKREIKILEDIWNSPDAEFVAVYGRRRVGKTHLIREYFSNKGTYFELVGMKDVSLHIQLENFIESFSNCFHEGLNLKSPHSWREAFQLLTKEIQKVPKRKKIVIFLDELPWLARRKSGLIQALDYFWNKYWCLLPNLKLIVCGSAASWMLDKLINAKGGLHNRITRSILLKPLSLKETRNFLLDRKIHLSEKQTLDIYMLMGGIPHYLKQIRSGKSVGQIIQTLCFETDGLLYGEFDRLFHSLFDSATIHHSIIKEISTHRSGVSRETLLKNTQSKSGGTFNKRLEELEATGFIQKFIPYGRNIKDGYYRICDEYTQFYLNWIEPIRSKELEINPDYWKSKMRSPEYQSWLGYAFESICYKHISKISHALDIHGIECKIGSWRYVPKKGSSDHGAQIDLLFDRRDGIVSLCEIKYCGKPFSIEKEYAKNLNRKIDTFVNQFRTTKQIYLVMITVASLKRNLRSQDLVDNEVTLHDIFA